MHPISSARRAAVIVAFGFFALLPAKAATTTIPIVFYTGGEPIASGLVASLNRSGGNATASVVLSVELRPNQLQLLGELIPDPVLFGVLGNLSADLPDLQAASGTLGLQLMFANPGSDGELETAFATFLQQCVREVMVANGPFYIRRMDQLAAPAARHALPAIFPHRELALAGGLMSYGSTFAYTARQLGIYTSRILKWCEGSRSAARSGRKNRTDPQPENGEGTRDRISDRVLVRADEVIE